MIARALLASALAVLGGCGASAHAVSVSPVASEFGGKLVLARTICDADGRCFDSGDPDVDGPAPNRRFDRDDEDRPPPPRHRFDRDDEDRPPPPPRRRYDPDDDRPPPPGRFREDDD